MYTDASNTCIGACLTQESDDQEPFLPNVRTEKPIYYLSHKLSKTQCKWSTIEKEAFAIHFGLQKLDIYLNNAKVVIKTDHKPLKYLLEIPMQNKKIQLWALGMAGYNCTIKYIPGTENTCADLLSRKPDTKDEETETEPYDLDINDNAFEVGAINSNEFNPKHFAGRTVSENAKPEILKTDLIHVDMTVEQAKDEEIIGLKKILEHGEPLKAIKHRYLVDNDILYYLSDPDDNPNLRLFCLII